jgi:ABC-type polysaccharide/polyol phosphate transport system ATPase subunit
MVKLIQIDNVSFEYLYKHSTNSFSYKRKKVLNNINFSVSNSEILAILGKNGTGKSTILRLLASIYFPSNGSITFAKGILPRLMAPGVGFMNQLTGLENVVLSYSLVTGKNPTDDNISSILHYSGIADRINDPVSIYSTGMRARLAFATALETSSGIVLIDEALGAGDQSFRTKVNQTYKSKIKQGMSFVVVTHNLHWVRNHATRVIVMNKGEIYFDGPTPDAIEKFSEILD